MYISLTISNSGLIGLLSTLSHTPVLILFVMADNYLERQMEKYRSGKTIIRHLNPSLDILLHKLAEQDAVAPTEITAETDPSRIVRKAQLEAALRSARIVFGDTFQAEISEAGQYISIDEEGLSGKTSGGITLAMAQSRRARTGCRS